LLEDRRTDVPERRMPTALVVKHLDVLEQFPLGVAAALKPIRQFDLQCGVEKNASITALS
jgi:hypothetical protein